MPQTISIKKSSVQGKIPLSTDLTYGELALNYADGRLYYKNSNNDIDYIGSNINSTVTNTLTVTSSTQSSSTTTGALQVVGGAGIGGNLNVGGTINATGISINGSPIPVIIGAFDFGTFTAPVEYSLDMGAI